MRSQSDERRSPDTQVPSALPVRRLPVFGRSQRVRLPASLSLHARYTARKGKYYSVLRNILAEAFLRLLCGFGIGSSMSGTAGFFHNSQILAVDHAKKTVTFRYKSWLDVRTKEKSYKTVTMDIYEPFDSAQDKFMAKMLYFLPKKHQKMIRYYGIYAHGAGEKLKKIQNATWKAAIEHSFDTEPER